MEDSHSCESDYTADHSWDGGNADLYAVDSWEDIAMIEFPSVAENEVVKFHFADLGLAFDFYGKYAKFKGFSGRKSRTKKNSRGVVVMQHFVCFCEGFREEKYNRFEERRRVAKPVTRCGCKAMMQVRMQSSTSRWFVTYFSDEHNHRLLRPTWIGMLPSHREMSEGDIEQMNFWKMGGLTTRQIYGAQVCQSGGRRNVRYELKDMYNEVGKRKRHLVGDASAAVAVIKDMARKDNFMYYSYAVDNDKGRIRNLFWADGRSQLDYDVFGDVLAFDATYKKNRYRCPVVVFSGVNHHNQTTVFGVALISDETEETYVWLLEQFIAAMKGKAPVSVMTDGDLAMRNAIRKVFPNANHRLCAWHIMRNATRNIGNPKFTAMFKKLLYGDYSVAVFRQKWFDMVKEFGVEDRAWISEMYEKREMWAAAHIRGKFFAGYRTISRCEGLHSLLKKYVKSHFDLAEFVHHFHRCLANIRYNEMKADFECARNFPVMESKMVDLETHAAQVFTRTIFTLFRPELQRACTLKVVDSKVTCDEVIYKVARYGRDQQCSWHVSVFEEEEAALMFECSCQKMETLGIPCAHIVVVLFHLDICELPRSLVLDRWTVNEKAHIPISEGCSWDSVGIGRYICLEDWGKRVYSAACLSSDLFYETRDLLIGLFKRFKAGNDVDGVDQLTDNGEDVSRDPAFCKTKGTKAGGCKRKRQRCTICREEGHNQTSCVVWKHTRSHRNSSVEECVDLNDGNGAVLVIVAYLRTTSIMRHSDMAKVKRLRDGVV